MTAVLSGPEDWLNVSRWREGPCIYHSPKTLNKLLEADNTHGR